MSRHKLRAVKKVEKKLLKLDFGCGPNPREGFDGVDKTSFEGKAKYILDIGTEIWPWADNSVEEAHTSHFIEHLTQTQRIHFANELYRVLIPDGKCTLIAPHWSSQRAYGDPTHQWPPISEFWFYYMDIGWRMANAPHTDIKYWNLGFNCDFGITWGYNCRADLQTKNPEQAQMMMANYKDVLEDFIATFVARKPLKYPEPKKEEGKKK